MHSTYEKNVKLLATTVFTRLASPTTPRFKACAGQSVPLHNCQSALISVNDTATRVSAAKCSIDSVYQYLCYNHKMTIASKAVRTF